MFNAIKNSARINNADLVAQFNEATGLSTVLLQIGREDLWMQCREECRRAVNQAWFDRSRRDDVEALVLWTQMYGMKDLMMEVCKPIVSKFLAMSK
tara:strand:- start:389 stop:676 length:288 start_codon:yes stop_codon:yes gene_type:complete